MARRAGLVAAALVLAACTAVAEPESRRVMIPVTPSPTPDPVLEITYRVDVRVDEPGFARFLAETLDDPRGWTRARFRFVQDAAGPYTVVLAEGDEVDVLCHPYRTGGEFSCQNGPVVALNAERWREAVPHWSLGLDDYRRMLVNHELGHLIGQRHRACAAAGRPAPVMFQQSGSLPGCLANPWPLPGEIDRAARHDQKIAPGYGE